MKDMTEMEMPLPDNTAAMMTGTGPFGAVGMGGMFSVVKVRKDQKPADYTDPGWFQHPPGTVAYEYKEGNPPTAPQAPAQSSTTGHEHHHKSGVGKDIEVQVRKPSGHSGH
jgi:hypothetical protein